MGPACERPTYPTIPHIKNGRVVKDASVMATVSGRKIRAFRVIEGGYALASEINRFFGST